MDTAAIFDWRAYLNAIDRLGVKQAVLMKAQGRFTTYRWLAAR